MGARLQFFVNCVALALQLIFNTSLLMGDPMDHEDVIDTGAAHEIMLLPSPHQ